MSVNLYNGRGDSDGVNFSTRLSVIKSARSCCLDQDASIKYQDKLKSDIQLTHKNYMKIDQENNYLNLKVDDLDNRLKDQNYQYACLKYELEQLTSQKRVLNIKIKETGIVQSVSEQVQVNHTSSKINYQNMSKTQNFADKSNFHFADIQKLPELVCVCGVHFKTHQNLKEHIKYYSNKANFSCHICGIQKHGLNLLKHHMKMRHNVTNFPSVKGCRKCGMMFNTLEHLHLHRRQEHGRKSREENWKGNRESPQNNLYKSMQLQTSENRLATC